MARVIFREGEYLIDTLSQINGGISLISYLILFYISDYYVTRNHHDHVYLERAWDLQLPRSGQEDRLSQLQLSQADLSARFWILSGQISRGNCS